MASGAASRQPRRLNLDAEKTRNGLAQLVLTVVKLLHELLEKQALRRMEAGDLTDAEIERLGQTLMRQSEELARISREFGLTADDLNLDLGPLGKLL
ncbi:MAG: gas vesicle protein K [bacterium]